MEYLPAKTPGEFLLLTAPRSILRQFYPAWIARLALQGPVRILDGGNCFNAYSTARQLRMHTAHLEEALSRIYAARAFTPYQVVALLEATPEDAIPKLLLEPLGMFNDENVKPEERRRLLETCISRLDQLKVRAPITATVSLESVIDPAWLDLLTAAASRSWKVTPEPPRPVLRLF